MVRALDAQLRTIETFYAQHERDLFGRVARIIQEVEAAEVEGVLSSAADVADDPVDQAQQPSAAALIDIENSVDDNADLVPGRAPIPEQVPLSAPTNPSTPFPPTTTTATASGNPNGPSFASHVPTVVRPRRRSFLPITPSESDHSLWTSADDYAIDLRLMFKHRLSTLFVTLSELQQFVQLNAIALQRILKKYDDTLLAGRGSLRQTYWEAAKTQHPFSTTAHRALTQRIETVVAA